MSEESIISCWQWKIVFHHFSAADSCRLWTRTTHSQLFSLRLIMQYRAEVIPYFKGKENWYRVLPILATPCFIHNAIIYPVLIRPMIWCVIYETRCPRQSSSTAPLWVNSLDNNIVYHWCLSWKESICGFCFSGSFASNRNGFSTLPKIV